MKRKNFLIIAKNMPIKLIIAFLLFFSSIEMSIRYFTGLTNTILWHKYGLITIILALLLHYSTKYFKIFIILFLAFSILIQTSYSSLYGSWITSSDLYLLFADLPEVIRVASKSNILTTVKLISFLLISIIFSTFVYKIAKRNKGNIWANWLVIFFFAFQPLKFGIFSPEKIEKLFVQDTHSLLKSSYRAYESALSLTISNIFNNHIYRDYQHSAHTREINQLKDKPNVFIYFGESLSSKYMSAFDYPKDTTPFIKKLINSKLFILSKEAISGAVYTRPSSTLFFHLIPGPDGRTQAASFNTNLFKYAKESGYSTTYLSTQAENGITTIAKLIAGKYADRYLFNSDLDKEYKDGDTDKLDELALNGLQKIKLDKPFFAVFQASGSHLPFSAKSPESFKKFGKGSELSEYENSVLYADTIIDKLISWTKEQSHDRPWIFIITSDHGTYIDESHVTRSVAYPASYTVPGIIITNNEEIFTQYLAPYEKCNILFHNNIATIIARTLGFKVQDEGCNQGVLLEGLISGVHAKHIINKNREIIIKPYEQ